MVKKLESIQQNTNLENQLRDLTNMVNASGEKPYLMRMFLELSKGHPSCSRWKIDNNGNTYSNNEVCRDEGDGSPIGKSEAGAEPGAANAASSHVAVDSGGDQDVSSGRPLNLNVKHGALEAWVSEVL